MEIIIDANILFSALIKSGKTEELIVDERLKLIAPEFIFEEFLKYEQLILSKTARNDTEFQEFMYLLKKRIVTIPVKKNYLIYARKVSPDINDVDYIALALQTGYPIWSNDKELKKQQIIKIYNTTELLLLFS
jgi:predicted nucleic acid-binding protein